MNQLHFEEIRGVSRVTTMTYSSPLKIFQIGKGERDHPARIMLSTYGGGLLQGDRIELEIKSDSGSKAVIESQANTHILKNETGEKSFFSIEGTVEKGAQLVMKAEPVVLHSRARYHQKQRWDLEKGSKFILIDWIQSGRSESNEAFLFTDYQSELEIYFENRLELIENFRFHPEDHDPKGVAGFGTMNHLLSIYLFGYEELDLSSLPVSTEQKRIENFLENRTRDLDPFYISQFKAENYQLIRALVDKRLSIEPLLEQVNRMIS